MIVGLLSAVLLSSCSFGSVKIPSRLLNEIAETVESENTIKLSDYGANLGYDYLPSIGTQSILVLPIMFSDYPCESSSSSVCQTALQEIKTAFNGTDDEQFLKANPDFMSVRDFYRQSSYDKLQLNFNVYDKFLIAPDTFQNCKNQINSNPELGQSLSGYIMNSVYLNYRDFTADPLLYNTVIGIYYADPAKVTEVERELFWSFTVNYSKETVSPFRNYLWSSYFELKSVTKYGLDTHTYIHETGHVLGLDDYYNYDNPAHTPSGVLDTMAANVGDHNAYSKFLLGWINPVTPTSEGKITLKPYTESGDALIIGNEWNKTALDEYIILTYYTPTGLYERDLNYPTYKMYSKPGILAYHVDSRLAKWLTAENFTIVEDIDGLDFQNFSYEIAHSNTPSYTLSNNRSNYLLELLESGGTNTVINGYLPSNSALFKTGSTFGVQTYNSFAFHSGKKAQFDFYVSDLTATDATIYVAE